MAAVCSLFLCGNGGRDGSRRWLDLEARLLAWQRYGRYLFVRASTLFTDIARLAMKIRPIAFIALSASIAALTVEGAVAQTESPASPNWGKFHTTAEAHALLEGWARA